MSPTTPNVGVRVFSDVSPTIATINAAESHIGLCLPCPNDDASIEKHKPMAISTDDPTTIALLGDGVAKDTFTQIAAAGITTTILFARAEDAPVVETQIGHIAGDAALKTGIWALEDALSETKLEPALLLAPGYTSQRLGAAANPVATAMDALSDKIIDCMGITDTPETNREDAATYAADFATSYNMIACYPQARVWLNGADATAPLSTHVAAAIVRRDAEVGNRYKAAWNRPLTGIRGVSQTVTYQDGRTDHDANYLNQNGVVTVIENKLLWGPYTTATDPTTVGYRSIKRIRTRRDIEKAFLRALRKPELFGLGDGVADRLDRARAAGNGVCPLAAARAWRTLRATFKRCSQPF